MKYCSNCGVKIETTQNFCSNCGFPLQSVEMNGSAEQVHNDKQKLLLFITDILQSIKASKYKKIFVIAVILLVIIIGIVSFSSEPTLKHCEKLLGTSVEDILSDREFTVENFGDAKAAISSTKDIFGINGQIIFFILPSEEDINMVSWQSDNEISLTTSDIEYFTNSMIKKYGKPDTASDNLYLWLNSRLEICLYINEYNEILITWGNSE